MTEVNTAGGKEFPIRVLVVDDHPYTATTLARAISQIGDGIEVLSATSGKQALDYANLDAIDVLITDLMMPDMNGLELIERLEAHPAGRTLHTILMTAYDIPGLKETARRLNVKEVIIKPVPTEQICRSVSDIVEHVKHTEVPLQGGTKSHRFKILIADDLPDNITLLSRYIRNEGYEYITAENGVEALEKTRTEMPDLVLLDINMPEKDGFAVVEEMRADPQIKHIPVIILTAARPSPGDILRGLNLGADDYITKPFDKRELLARIRTKLRAKEVEDAVRQRNRELSILPEIARELSARLDVNELLEVALRGSVEALQATVGYIAISGTRQPSYQEYRTSTSGAPPSGEELPPLSDLLKKMNDNRASLLIEDTCGDTGWGFTPKNSARSVLMVPMVGRLDLLGVFILAHEHPGYFSAEHQLLLQAIASQASIAVENARLYASLIQEEQKLTAVLDHAADAILMFDAEKGLALVNPAARKLFADFELSIGQCLPDHPGYDPLLRLLDQTKGTSTSLSKEIEWPDRRVFSASVTSVQERGWVVVLHDVTHFNKLERVKNEFIASASHDLRNPITAITGFGRLIKVAGPLNQQQLDFVQRIQNSAESMWKLVENMLDLTKTDLGVEYKRETLDIALLIAELVDEFRPHAEARSQTLTFETTETNLNVQGDAVKLRQALRNLMENAIKYTPAEGRITLTLEKEIDKVWVSIQDSGYGIPAADLPFIFDRFYRARSNDTNSIEGNGLGLAIVKSIIERHGGQVKVESQPGMGSCFRFSLPPMQPESLAASNLEIES